MENNSKFGGGLMNKPRCFGGSLFEGTPVKRRMRQRVKPPARCTGVKRGHAAARQRRVGLKANLSFAKRKCGGNRKKKLFEARKI